MTENFAQTNLAHDKCPGLFQEILSKREVRLSKPFELKNPHEIVIDHQQKVMSRYSVYEKPNLYNYLSMHRGD